MVIHDLKKRNLKQLNSVTVKNCCDSSEEKDEVKAVDGSVSDGTFKNGSATRYRSDKILFLSVLCLNLKTLLSQQLSSRR